MLKIVESTDYFGTDRINCKCFAELFDKLLRDSALKGKLATLPWNSGQQKFIFMLFYWATVNMCYSVFVLLFFCHFNNTSGIPKLNWIIQK